MLVMSDKKEMMKLGIDLITSDIKQRTLRKAAVDKELVQEGITPIRITNGIEVNSKWLRLLGSPLSPQWVSKRAKKITNSKDIAPLVAEEIEKAVEFLNKNFVDPNILRPDVNAYWNIVEYPMSKECEGYLAKPSGN
jgi:hypothetical protein